MYREDVPQSVVFCVCVWVFSIEKTITAVDLLHYFIIENTNICCRLEINLFCTRMRLIAHKKIIVILDYFKQTNILLKKLNEIFLFINNLKTLKSHPENWTTFILNELESWWIRAMTGKVLREPKWGKKQVWIWIVRISRNLNVFKEEKMVR